jgi:hypothetical protein
LPDCRDIVGSGEDEMAEKNKNKLKFFFLFFSFIPLFSGEAKNQGDQKHGKNHPFF